MPCRYFPILVNLRFSHFPLVVAVRVARGCFLRGFVLGFGSGSGCGGMAFGGVLHHCGGADALGS